MGRGLVEPVLTFTQKLTVKDLYCSFFFKHVTLGVPVTDEDIQKYEELGEELGAKNIGSYMRKVKARQEQKV